jgi:hypothetical protein
MALLQQHLGVLATPLLLQLLGQVPWKHLLVLVLLLQHACKGTASVLDPQEVACPWRHCARCQCWHRDLLLLPGRQLDPANRCKPADATVN